MYRDVLLGLTTYPNPTAIDAVKWSASFAEFMNCRITARAQHLLQVFECKR
jgi:hypothetical protein